MSSVGSVVLRLNPSSSLVVVSALAGTPRVKNRTTNSPPPLAGEQNSPPQAALSKLLAAVKELLDQVWLSLQHIPSSGAMFPAPRSPLLSVQTIAAGQHPGNIESTLAIRLHSPTVYIHPSLLHLSPLGSPLHGVVPVHSLLSGPLDTHHLHTTLFRVENQTAITYSWVSSTYHFILESKQFFGK